MIQLATFLINNYGFILNIIFNCMVPILYNFMLLHLHTTLQFIFVEKQNAILSVMLYFIIQYVCMQSMHIFSGISLSLSLPKYLMRKKNESIQYIFKLSLHNMSHSHIIDIQSNLNKYLTSLTKIMEQIWIIWIPLLTDLFISIYFIIIAINMHIAYVLILWMIIIGVTMGFMANIYNLLSNKNNECNANENKFLFEYINNILFTKIYNLEDYILSKFDNITRKTKKTYETSIFMLNVNKFFIGFINILLCLCTLYFIYKYVNISAEKRAKVFAICWTLTRTTWSMATNTVLLLNLFSEYHMFKNKLFAYKIIAEDNNKRMLNSIESISAINYNLQKDNLKLVENINFNWSSNGIFTIKGRSGIGKTSFLLILCGLYNNVSDGLYINNVNIDEYNRTSIKNNFLVSLQHDHVYNMSIADNIVLNAKYNILVLNNVLTLTGFQTIIERRKWNIDTFICESKGNTLSGGERKLISLCRIFYRLFLNKNQKYVLILDEPFNHVDTYLIQDHLLPLIKELSQQYMIIVTCHSTIFESIANHTLYLI